ncbi:MAG TPA: LysR substrate-binding domain-containing protein [Candidatus Eisenbacteria bacterium]|nr:LysR substrate-binding domain-containing protein [Candidatus Eisenbacteria bacterium]
MEIRQLKSLCLIAKHGTVKEAARRSFVTSSAISLQIKVLERELGVRIFDRVGKRLVLTKNGEALYQDAEKILHLIDEAIAKAARPGDDFSGKISLAAPACLRNFYLPAIARFRASYPSIRLTILARNHAAAPSTVASGEADLALGLFDQIMPDLEKIPLVAPKLTVIVPHGHPLAFKRYLDLEELAQHPLVLLQPGATTRKVIDGSFRKAHLPLRIGMEASTCAEIKRYVANNIGAGIIHNICIDPEDQSRFRSIGVEKLFPHPEAKLIFRRPKSLTAGEKKLIELLQATAEGR